MNHQKKIYLLRFTVIILTLSTFIYIFNQQYSELGLVNRKFTTPKVRPVNKNALLIYTYKVLDAELCDSKLKFTDRTNTDREDIDKKCPRNGIVTVATGGRTANQMWEYASVWATARLTGLDPYIPSCIRHHLEPIFDNLSLPALTDIADCSLGQNLFVMSIDEWTDKNETIILPRYISEERALRWLDDLRKEFKFEKKLTEKAESTLEGFLEMLPKLEYTFVGVHVRRTDYIKHLENKFDKLPAGPEFYKKAMQFYSDRLPNCLFIFVSDEPEWCSRHFGQLNNVMVSWGNTPAEDLALLAACNHSVFDYGTFGEWGAILTGGMTVYSNLSQNIRKGKVMKDWQMI